ncbi:uncharacterized protein LOC117648623 [Thrips palmi]|uniref:Uncharacterized protein LOC117648623 n=1 Tax=Thrips palmi TaxID=161013 RepID=A0A6P8Z976_THRPL|nr:uncharacterized protein LOC117648623 [Thrips palmi]
MAETLGGSSKSLQLKRLIAQQRTLLQEKAALEQMLKNVQALRNKLKVEQIQLSSSLQAELGGSETYVEVPAESITVKTQDIVEEEKHITSNKPILDLKTDHFQRMFLGGTDNGEEEEDDDDSDDAIGCVQELMDEHELGFDDF